MGAHDRGITAEDKRLAGNKTGGDPVTNGQHAIETIGQFPFKHLDVIQQVARLHAGDDTQLNESRHVGGVDELEVRDVVHVKITSDLTRRLELLFDPDYALDDRILMEQFLS